MGLAIEVGILTDLSENDKEGFDYERQQFESLNEFLKEAGLPLHSEPEQIDDVVSYEMFGYSGLHYLRRFAAHIAETGKLPSPGTDDAHKDTVLEQYSDEDLTPVTRRFRHLIIHSDAEGYYLPIEFQDVLFPSEGYEIAGDGMIGSSFRLLEECEELAKVLEIPEDLDPESDEVWEAVETQGVGEVTWEKYGVETFVCTRLMFAARHSIKTGAAIVFC